MINLLPPWVQRKKKRLLLIKILVTVQVAIFLFLGTITLLVVHMGQQVWIRSEELTNRLAVFDLSPSEIAARVREERFAAEYMDALFTGMPFNRQWVSDILATVPQGANLIRLDYREGELLLIGEILDLAIVESHRANMAEIFNYVRLGRISLIDEGLYSYEIWAWVGEMP